VQDLRQYLRVWRILSQLSPVIAERAGAVPRPKAQTVLKCISLALVGCLLAVQVAGVGLARVSGQAAGSGTPGYMAQVHLTLPDQSKLVQRQADVAFVNNRPAAANDLQVRVDPSRTYQTMDGVGAAMTESSAYLFSAKMTAAQRTDAFNKLFSKQSGAGIDVVRVPWGATDFSLSNYTYNDRTPAQGDDVAQSDFSIANDQQYMIPMLQSAMQTNSKIKLFFAPWSAPRWMKQGIVAPPEWPLATGSLRDELYPSYNTYLTKAINGYTANWLWPYSVTAQNHPTILTSHPSMFMNQNQQAGLIKYYLGPSVRDATMAKPKILTLDDDWSKTAYPMSVMGDPAAAPFTGGTAFHCYNGEPTQQLLVQKVYPDKDIHMTECTGSNTSPASWAPDFRWGVRNLIINSTRDYAKSVIYWNLALDENAGPKTSPTAGCQNCRGVMTVKADGTTTLGPEYYILAHYGKFVQPGATRIESTTYGEGAVETVAFKNPDNSRVLVALNSGQTSRDFTVREGNASLRYTLPAGAAATFTWTMPVNTKADVDNGRVEAEAYNASQPANVAIIDVTDQGKQDRAAQLWTDQSIRFDGQQLQGGAPLSFQIRYRSLGTASLEFHQDALTGPLLAAVPLTPGDWKTSDVVTGSTVATAGSHNIYAVLKNTSATIVDLNWFKFAQNPTVPTPIADRSAWKAYGIYGGGTDVPTNVLDGNEASRWTTGYPMTYGHWFVVDLGKQTALTGLSATAPAGDHPRNLKVEVSDNGADYQVAQPSALVTTDQYEVPFTAKTVGRYVRLTEQSDTPQTAWWSISELNFLNR
jgi:glucosylceramidase